jgi:hypothetical protein
MTKRSFKSKSKFKLSMNLQVPWKTNIETTNKTERET